MDAVSYRQEVFTDLACPAVMAAVSRLVTAMDRVQTMRRGRDGSRYAQASDIWDVHIASGYVAAVDRCDRDLRELADAGKLGSRALNALRCWLCDYAGSDPFVRPARRLPPGRRGSGGAALCGLAARRQGGGRAPRLRTRPGEQGAGALRPVPRGPRRHRIHRRPEAAAGRHGPRSGGHPGTD
ncbi:MAG: hypothetical protein LKI24_16230 [Acidipropionibacterium sp.]|nr:hypothetical protein [Acidipropionibacterium sp.]